MVNLEARVKRMGIVYFEDAVLRIARVNGDSL